MGYGNLEELWRADMKADLGGTRGKKREWHNKVGCQLGEKKGKENGNKNVRVK